MNEPGSEAGHDPALTTTVPGDARPTVPAAGWTMAPPPRAKSRAPALLAVLAVLGVVASVINGQQHDAQRIAERRQVAAEMSRALDSARALSADSGASASSIAPIQATASNPTVRIVQEHLEEVRQLDARFEHAMGVLDGDGFMGAASIASSAGRRNNQAKIDQARGEVEAYFDAMKAAKQRVLSRLEGIGGVSASQRAQYDAMRVMLDRAHGASRQLLDALQAMNQFAEQHRPVLQQHRLLFHTEAEIAQWRQLGQSLEATRKALGQTAEDMKRFESDALARGQQTVDQMK